MFKHGLGGWLRDAYYFARFRFIKGHEKAFEWHVWLFGWGYTEWIVRIWDTLGLGFMVQHGWRHVLTRANRRLKLVEYTRERMARKPADSRRGIDFVAALVEARDFGAARGAIDTITPQIFTSMRNAARTSRALGELRTIVDAELSLEKGGHATIALGEAPRVAGHFYTRLWEMHSMLDTRRVQKYARLHLESFNFQPNRTLYISEKILVPNGLYADVEAVCRRSLDIWGGEKADLLDSPIRAFFRQSQIIDYIFLQRGVNNRLLRLNAQLRKVRIMLMDSLYNQNKPLDPATIGDIGLKDATMAMAIFDARRDVIEKRYESALPKLEMLVTKTRAGTDGDVVSRELVQELYLQYGMACESSKRFATARAAYQRAAEFTSDEEWHGESNWRYTAMLLFRGEWDEAKWIMRRQLGSYWSSLKGMSRHKMVERLKKPSLLLDGDVLVMGGRGLGDEIFRLMVLRSIRKPGAHYYYTVDPRLVEVFGPGNDWLTPVPISRTSGPFAVSEAQFWAQREGVPKSYDVNRATVEVLDLRRKLNRNVMMSEDLFVQSILLGQEFKASPEPLFNVRDEELARIGQWLGSLPGKLKVGISWRSGSRDFLRDVSYKDILECGDLLGLRGVDFINLQYSDTSEEVAEVKARFGADIHTMPGLNLKDDIRDICALALACDVVIAPSTAVRELAGAAGANLWSLTITPYVPDLWRRDGNSNQDRFYPTMRHFCVIDHGDSNGVIRAMADEISSLLAKAPENWTMREIRQHKAV